MTTHPTVVVVLMPVRGGLLMMPRGVAEGHGERALPGGCHMRGETWQEAGARDGEVIDVLVVHGPVRTAFPLHDAIIVRFFR